jgi:sulfate transport system permease protein
MVSRPQCKLTMATNVISIKAPAVEQSHSVRLDPALVRWPLIAVSLVFFVVFLVVPLIAVFAQAFEKGIAAYFDAIRDPESLAAVRLTLLTALVAIPVNATFGMLAAWVISRFEFLGKHTLLTLIDLPLSISPVISGLVFVLVLGARGILGPFLERHDIKIIFAFPGIILATLFVTVPYVARELIPLMQEQGSEEEQAAVALGAGAWQVFQRVTLPNVRWGFLYGVVLLNARVMGEFGAVSVVSGHIRGLTNTMPLQVEILYNDYNFVGAFAVASLLALVALVSLAAKNLVEWQVGQSRSHRHTPEVSQ